LVAGTELSWLGWACAHPVLASRPLAKFLHSAYRVFHNPCSAIKNAVASSPLQRESERGCKTLPNFVFQVRIVNTHICAGMKN